MTAAAPAEGAAARELRASEGATDRLGQRLGARFIREATGGEQGVEPGPASEPVDMVVTPASTEFAFDDKELAKDSEKAAVPSPMRQPK